MAPGRGQVFANALAEYASMKRWPALLLFPLLALASRAGATMPSGAGARVRSIGNACTLRQLVGVRR